MANVFFLKQECEFTFTMSRARKTRTEIRQEQIARAALTLIARRGLNQLNISALAAEVGVVPSAIYRHYAGKDAVLDAVIELISASLTANVEAVRQAKTDPFERLHLLLEKHVRLVRHHAGIPRVIFSEQIFAGDSRRRKRVHQTIQRYLRQIAVLVAEGQKERAIRADLPPDTVSVMFLGLIQPAIILRLMSNGKFNVSEHVERAWQLFQEILTPHDRVK